MTRMTGPGCAVMGNLINTRTHTHTHTHTRVDPVDDNPNDVENSKDAGGEHKIPRAQVRVVQVERVCSLCRV